MDEQILTHVIEVVGAEEWVSPLESRVVARGDLFHVAGLFPVLVMSGKYRRVRIWTEDWENLVAEWDAAGIPGVSVEADVDSEVA